MPVSGRRASGVISVFFSLFLLVLLSFQSFAAETEFKTVSTERLKGLLESKNIPLLLVDARTAAEYKEAHINSAINIPDRNFDEMVSLLPADKHTLLIIYCNGIKCGKSKNVATKAQGLGFDNIFLYSDGIPGWIEKGLPVSPAQEK